MTFVEESQEIDHHFLVLFRKKKEVKIYRLHRDDNLYPCVDEDGTKDLKELALRLE